MTDELRKRFAKGWGSGGRETRCGAGSTLSATLPIRLQLPDLFRRYGIRSVNDAGAGDLNWITHVDLTGIDYRPYDLVPRHERVIEADITTEVLPHCDLVLCRAVLNHLGPEHVVAALKNFQRSGRYLLATQFSVPRKNFADFENYDLREFGLGEPLEALLDYPGELALWAL